MTPPQDDIDRELQMEINEVIRDELGLPPGPSSAATPNGTRHEGPEEREARELQEAITASLQSARVDAHRSARAEKAADAAERRRHNDKKRADEIQRRVTVTYEGPRPRKVRRIKSTMCAIRRRET